ncbi:triose-phosphate isomerase [Streptococcus ovuberis]|uniref:Triosephosphate isomerase n=1 Tax=Streptococcus ovuberis TaxID=1936207 RepID=A0A7X6S163_9STRE|nr:triose-phosphate isomerase [Streptococcus ovuberis]NKZ20045.1 triose-phosphate isomerase [Streptococcus ovuberis]
MSRKPIIAGNWKMNKTHKDARAFVEAIQTKIPSKDLVDTVIGSPAIFLEGMKKGIRKSGSELKVAAQNCYFEDFGAYTGENSPATIAALDVEYVIIGHSERRDYFKETDEDINKKAHAIFRNGMTPIICCGESLETYEAGKAVEFVGAQVSAALKGLTAEQVASSVIAYEPIWAIGTGKSATQDDAQKMCKAVRDVVANDFGQDVADKVRVQYGGSVKPENIADYMACPDVDGALVGGASLEADSFLALLDFVN